MIETLLSKIITVLIKKAIASTIVKTIVTAFEVYTVIDTIYDTINIIETKNDCKELGLIGIKVTSDYMTESSIDKIIQIGDNKFYVEKTKSGIYVASRYVPTFKLNESSEIISLFNSPSIISPLSNNPNQAFREVNNDMISRSLKNRFRKLDD